MTIAMRPWRKSTWTVLIGVAGLVGLVWLAAGWGVVAPAAANGQESRARQGAVTVSRRDFVRGVRLSGTVEAIQSTTIAAPRLAGYHLAGAVTPAPVPPPPVDPLARAGSPHQHSGTARGHWSRKA